MQPDGKGRVRLEYRIPARGLIGFQSEFLTMTRGTGLMSHIFDDYGPLKGDIAERRNGVLISQDDGNAVAYALWKLQERGRMFVDPGVDGSPKSAEDLRPWASRTRKCFVTTSRADFCRESWRGASSRQGPGLGHARRSRAGRRVSLRGTFGHARIGGACKDSARIASARRGQRVGRPGALPRRNFGLRRDRHRSLA